MRHLIKPWTVVIATLGLLFFGTGGYWSATWLSKWTLLMGFGTLALSVWAARATSLWHLPLMIYMFASLLAVGAWPQSPYEGTVDAVTLLALQKNAFAGLAEVAIGVAFFILAASPAYARGTRVALPLLWLVGTVMILTLPLHGFESPPNNGLWFGNPSMAASLLACLLPFVWLLYRNPCLWLVSWLLTLLLAYRTGASVPWGILGVVTAAVWVSRNPRRMLCLPAFAAALIALGMTLLGHDFWDPNGRLEVWSMAWEWFRLHGSLVWGMGYSTSQVLLPLEQVVTGHYHGEYFLWLHNDWLQLFIEGGIVGMACLLLSLSRLLTVAWKSPALFGSLTGFVALACFNYPLRMPIHCFCLMLIGGMVESTDFRHFLQQPEAAGKTDLARA